MSQQTTLAALLPSPRQCPACASTALFWEPHYKNQSGVAEGRLRTGDVRCVFVLGCEDCSETVAVYDADKVAVRLTAQVEQAATAPALSLIELIETRRIALTPEHGAGWSAEVYDEEAAPRYTGHGFTLDEAITAALSPEPVLLVMAEGYEAAAHQGIPGTSYQALNAKANQGDL